MLVASAKWKATYPGAALGVLAMSSVANPKTSPELENRKARLEAALRSTFGSFDRSQLKSLPVLAAYNAYFKRFDKTYHVLHQLESVVFKGKPIPRGAALVEAMFMAELKNLLLTAGHDLDSVHGQVVADVAKGDETYLTLGGQQQTLKPGDMFIHDEMGILSSIIYGPAHRTPISPTTSRVLFTVYAPAGISPEEVRHHLDDLAQNVAAVSPAANADLADVLSASP
jgi:DNA/RNA-binding domain of Phe-tRNA-synthetase-like protein